jgi:recombination protein RecR
MDNMRRLEEIFAHFPGIGPRQARRFVYYLLNKSPASIKEFTQLVEEVKKSSAECASCHRFFMHKKAGESLCSVCSDESRDKTSLMVVARDSDFESIEKSGAYKGFYFILGGTVPILDKEPEKRIRLQKLLEKIDASKDLKEIILSLNTTPDGEHTADIVREAIQKILNGKSVKISVLGRGLSTGAELEYVDGETIKNALENRH